MKLIYINPETEIVKTELTYCIAYSNGTSVNDDKTIESNEDVTGGLSKGSNAWDDSGW